MPANQVCSSRSQPADRNTPAATSSTSSSANELILKGNWRSPKLMGLDVYNQNNEKLGDVNEIILDKSGKVTAVSSASVAFWEWEGKTSL